MTQTNFMTGFMIGALGYILVKCIIEATAEAREHRKIRRDWEEMKRKEFDHE